MTSLPEPDPIAADRRRTRRRALVPAEAACVLCGDTRPAVLEDQHVLGATAADTVRVWLCRNCHATQTAQQLDMRALPRPGRYRDTDTTVLHELARVLRGLAVFVHALAHSLCSYADRLAALVTVLDTCAPQWRTLAGAL